MWLGPKQGPDRKRPLPLSAVRTADHQGASRALALTLRLRALASSLSSLSPIRVFLYLSLSLSLPLSPSLSPPSGRPRSSSSGAWPASLDAVCLRGGRRITRVECGHCVCRGGGSALPAGWLVPREPGAETRRFYAGPDGCGGRRIRHSAFPVVEARPRPQPRGSAGRRGGGGARRHAAVVVEWGAPGAAGPRGSRSACRVEWARLFDVLTRHVVRLFSAISGLFRVR